MSPLPVLLPKDPAVLQAMVAALQVQVAQLSATVRVYDQLIQSLQLRIAKLKKQVFGKSSEKVAREIEQLELALEGLLIAAAEVSIAAADEDADVAEAASDTPERKPRRRPRVSATTPRERRELDPGTACPDCGGALRLVGEEVSEMLDMVVEEVLPLLREGGPGASAKPTYPRRHGNRLAAGLHPRLQVRRSPAALSPQ
jgi:transposase